MKRVGKMIAVGYGLLALLLLSSVTAAQDTQLSASFVLREQTRLGYNPHNFGAKVEGDYKFNDAWTVLGSATAMHTPKHDSETGNSAFLAAGVRWAPLRYKVADVFGEFDLVGGYLSTKPYRKGVLHFKNGLGVRLMERRLLFEVSRLYQDMLPDASKALREHGFDPSQLHATFNQLSGWDYEAQYWAKPLRGKWGLKFGFRIQENKFINAFAFRRRGWLVQYEAGPYKGF